MKFLNLFLRVGILFSVSCALYHELKEEKAVPMEKVPPSVRDAFAKRHPGVTTNFHKHEVDESESFEAHYVAEGKEHSERFSSDGELIETEVEIDFASIPGAARERIQTYLRKEDEHSHTQAVQEINTEGFDGYELKVKTMQSRTTLMEYLFKKDGSFFHKEEIKLEAVPTLY